MDPGAPGGRRVRHTRMGGSWFNNRRLLEPIGNVPPAEAEAAHYAALEEPAALSQPDSNKTASEVVRLAGLRSDDSDGNLTYGFSFVNGGRRPLSQNATMSRAVS